MDVKAFCEQVPTRDWNNLWQINSICRSCFQPQATIIGYCYVVIVSSPSPLAELLHYSGLEEWLVIVDFDEHVHAELGGSFDLFLITSNTLECKQYQAFYPKMTKK